MLFQLHMLFGLSAAIVLALRVFLGIFGSRYVRFSQLPLSPTRIAPYFAGVVTGRTRHYVGHNPGSALAALAMFLLVPALVISGIRAEAFEDAHGVLAYVLIAMIVVHLCGLVVHTIRHRENIAASMVTGRVEGAPEDGLRTAHPIWGIVLAILGVDWIVALFGNHDAQAAAVRLPMIGTVLQLGEPRGESHHDDDKHDGNEHRAEGD